MPSTLDTINQATDLTSKVLQAVMLTEQIAPPEASGMDKLNAVVAVVTPQIPNVTAQSVVSLANTAVALLNAFGVFRRKKQMTFPITIAPTQHPPAADPPPAPEPPAKPKNR